LLEAAAIYHSGGDATHEAGALNNVARTYLLLGDQRQAIEILGSQVSSQQITIQE